jgi:hypothetical protein
MVTSDVDGRVADRVFLTPRGRPRLVDGAVLFVDLLGIREMNRSRRAAGHLVALERAIRRTYRAFLAPSSKWAATFFSDTLVLAAPVVEGSEDRAIPNAIAQAAWLQLELIRAGFFMRGGLSFGKIHLRDGVVFGPALVEAYELESRVAVHPRIVLSDTVERALRMLCSHDWSKHAPQASMLMCDDDGRTFVNYLEPVFAALPDPPPHLKRHADAIVSCLIAYSNDKHLWEKYRWVGEYHNEVVRQRLPHASDLLVPAAAMTWQFKAFA